MSIWLETGRSAIQEALVAAFDKIDDNARKEIQDRDRKDSELLGELQQLKTRAAEVDRLQQENESLKKEVQQIRQNRKDYGPEFPKSRKVLGELSPNRSLNHPFAKPQPRDVNATPDIQWKYNKLTAKYKALEKSCDEYRSKLRQRIEEIHKWAEGVDSRDRLIRHLKEKLALAQSRLEAHGSSETRPNGTGIGEPVDDEPLDIAASVPGRPSPVSNSEQPKHAVSHTTVSLTTSTHASLGRTPRPVIPRRVSDGILKDSTDEDGCVDDDIELPRLPEPCNDDSRVVVKVELSSDGPVFISERSVRKRKHDREDEPTDNRLQRIKSEHSSSGPECVGDTHNFTPTESFDFEEEAHVPTPRKRRDLSNDRLQDQGPDTKFTPGPGLSDILRRGALAPSIAAGTPRTPAQGSGLTPSTYNPSAPHAGLERQARPATPREQQTYQSRSALHFDMGTRDLAADRNTDLNTIQRPVARSLLGALMNSPSVTTPKPMVRSGLPSVRTPRPALIDEYEDLLRVPAPRELPHGKKYTPKDITATPTTQQSTANTLSSNTTAARERPPKKPSILRDDMPRGRSAEKTSLRQKPMEKLRPEDFKPNPKYNDGLTYVYDEVNRGKSLAERAALSGCTDPNCCGKTFRAFAEAERSNLGPSVTTRAEDIKLLEDYLGDDAYKLGTMTREEKEEMWLQAKTWELASRFGRHRQRYARMPSPPGFWTVDFPNTQERAEERRQADEIRKALVHDRYREAMRPGGMWLFRDEEGR
ncbi:hypothetical protein VP1G_08344 [Cytospora mali]|uniref:DNA endonuclease activator Ctp1 C-terminal domain-containing protein n=1 Tax=Cytospora mali TaxID=578113 RepID=A0A194VB79_CYTMA|nr:hypothetical protein VP1G_08344 [Valsa mali var. pyri (nom. inval.)]